MINFDGKEMQEEFNEAFPIRLEDLNTKQLWWLSKFAKHVRGRCRSNAAFNNYMNRNFNAKFETVPKEYNGRVYQGLKITVNGESMEGEDNE